ncbi:MAG: ABC transporter substrate-binding protein [Nitrososphaerota archaeon]
MKRRAGLYVATMLMAMIFLMVPLVEAQVTVPREQTLVIGGAYWEPPKKWNPFNYGGSMSGTVGLIYEPLYIWVPIKTAEERFIPWLAKDQPTWESPTSVVIRLRDEAKWWDGTPVSADDIIFTFQTVPQKVTTAAWASVRNYIIEVQKVDSKTARIIFSERANYADFLFQLYSAPILPKHVLESFVDQYGDELTDLSKWPIVAPDKDPTKVVGSGMYKILYLADDHFILERVENWWGNTVLGKPAPKYIKGVVVYSNQVAANMLGAGELDWSCFYIPGGPDMVKRGLAVSYYKEPPKLYLPANVAYLFLNTQKEPFNDPRFRKAVYFAIDVDKLIGAAFEGAVEKSNPVGLLPVWKEYLATDLLAKYNYRYDPEEAKRILDAAGYVDRDRDGCRDLPDGRPIRMRIIVPYGWTDWMFAIINIADDLRKVGICAEAQFPDFGLYISEIDRGTYDAAINNFGSFAAPSPYSLYYWAFNATPGIWTGDHGRYDNPELERLITELGRIPPLPEYESEIKAKLRKIQEILLEEMPALPLWYNGYWFLASTKYWAGWPSEDKPYGVPTIWNGQWQHGGLLVLLNLKPVTVITPTAIATTVVTTVVTTVAPTTVVTTVAPTPTVTTITAPGTTFIVTITPEVTAAPPAIEPMTLAAIIIAVVVVIAVVVAILLRRRKK